MLLALSAAAAADEHFELREIAGAVTPNLFLGRREHDIDFDMLFIHR